MPSYAVNLCRKAASRLLQLPGSFVWLRRRRHPSFNPSFGLVRGAQSCTSFGPLNQNETAASPQSDGRGGVAFTPARVTLKTWATHRSGPSRCGFRLRLGVLLATCMAVRRFRNLWFALAALLWLPAYAHCQLAALTGYELLQCAEAFPAAADPGEDCADCHAIEQAKFRTSNSRLLLLPDEAGAECVTQVQAPAAMALLPAPWVVTAAPPDLAQRWQFLARTALPVRAPAPVS